MNVMKKFLNVLLILVGAALIVFCGDLVSNKLINVSYYSLDADDKAAIDELCSLTKQFDVRYGSDMVWNEDYNLRDYACVITKRGEFIKGSTYAVNFQCPKGAFSQKIDMPAEYDDISVYRLAYFTPETFALADMEKNGFVDFYGKKVYAALFDARTVSYNGAGSLEEEYVKATFEDAVDSLDVPQRASGHFEKELDNVALMGLEYRILDDMLSAQSKEQLKEYIAEYVIVRDAQDEKYPEFKAVREQTELCGGCSQFVFYTLSGMIDHNITYFNKEEADSINFYSAYYYLCTGRYNSDVEEFLDKSGDEYVGAALCRIIDDNELRRDWESTVGVSGDKIVTPYDVLHKYCDRSCSKYKDKTLDEIKTIYNYEESLGMARALLREIGID